MKRFSLLTRRISLNLLQVLLIVAWMFAATVSAQSNDDSTNQAETPSLGGVLETDGKIKKGAVGGFNADGFEMKLDANGAPRFVRSKAEKKNDDDSAENDSPAVTGVLCRSDYDPRFYGNGSFDDDSFYHFSSIEAIAADGNGNIFIGGRFSSINNVATKNIVRYNITTETWSALAHNGLKSGFGPDTFVKTMAISGNNLFVGGRLMGTDDGAVSFRNIARYDIAADAWFPLGGSGNGLSNVYNDAGEVRALAISGNDLFVGGEFTRSTNNAATNLKSIARYNIAADAFSPLAGNGLSDGNAFGTGYVNALLVSGSDLFVGGYFKQTVDGGVTNLNRIARFNIPTNTWSAFAGNGLRYGNVNALAMSGNFLFVGGSFNETDDGTTATNLFSIARYDIVNNSWLQTFAGGGLKYMGFLGSVEALAVSGNDLYVGGQFTETADNSLTNLTNIARYDISGNSWSPVTGNGLNGNSVFALELVGSDLFVGGRFTETANGSTKNINNLARYNSGAWSPLGSNNGVGMIGLDSRINAVAVDSNNYVYVGGILTPAYNGATSNLHNIARYDPATGVWTALAGDGLNNAVFAMTISGNDMFVGGNFTGTFDGTTATNLNGVARYDLSNGTWSPLAHGGLNGDVTALLVSGSDLFVGGLFTQTADGSITNLNRIARYNFVVPGGNWTALANNGLNSAVSSLAISVNYLFVGGSFSATADGAATNLNRIARYNLTTNSWAALTGNGLNSPVNALAVSGNDLYVGGFFTQTFDGATTNLNRIARYNIIAASNNWSALAGNGLNNAVYALVINGNNLFLGGSFTTTTDLSAVVTRVAGYNTQTNMWSGPSFGSGVLGINFIEVNNDVRALAVSGSDLIIGGLFTQVANCGVARFFTRHYLKKWSPPAAPFAENPSSTDWFDGANWSDGIAPPANTNAFIPANAGNISITSADVTMNDLLLNGGTLTVGAGRTLTINGTLGLGGKIDGAGTVIVTSCKPNSIINADAAAYIQTALARCVNNTGTFNFPVGTANGYSPVQLSNVAGTGNFTVKANQGAYSGTAANLPANRLQRFWDLTSGGIGSANVRFNYLASDVVGTESGYRAFRINGGIATNFGGAINTTNHSIFVTGVTNFSPWTLAQAAAPTAANVTVAGRVLNSNGKPITGARVSMTDENGNVRNATTNFYGFYRFAETAAGRAYILSVEKKWHEFNPPTRVLFVGEDVTDADFIATP